MIRFTCIITVMCLLAVNPLVRAQPAVTDPALITFRGTVYDVNDSTATPAPIVVNRRTGTGHAFMPGGEFSITGLKSDTFLVAAGGYEFRKFCFNDSVVKSTYVLKVGLTIRNTELNPVTIFPVKDLQTIKQDRQGLGVTPTRITEDGVSDAISSPITYIYERFSREGRSKALVAQLENEDRKNAVLKDLFRTYNRAGVITLPEEDFDAFILFLNMPEWYLKTASDYELAITIKQRYEVFIRSRQIHNNNQK